MRVVGERVEGVVGGGELVLGTELSKYFLVLRPRGVWTNVFEPGGEWEEEEVRQGTLQRPRTFHSPIELTAVYQSQS